MGDWLDGWYPSYTEDELQDEDFVSAEEGRCGAVWKESGLSELVTFGRMDFGVDPQSNIEPPFPFYHKLHTAKQ